MYVCVSTSTLHGGEFSESIHWLCSGGGGEKERERERDQLTKKQKNMANYFRNVTEQISNTDHRPHSYSTVQVISYQRH
jgi:hypothetical protein